jgi:hypothetical protein
MTMSNQMVTSINLLIKGFPNQSTKICGLLTLQSLHVLKKERQLNAASVPSTAHGYLGLFLGPNMSMQPK